MTRQRFSVESEGHCRIVAGGQYRSEIKSMLKRFFVNNFRSLLNVEFRPAGINLLVGPNNAGKTNLCSALRFVGGTSEQALDAAMFGAIGERWNITNFHVPQAKETEFEVENLR
jgi:recombinational DNA repair ATPase RecF